MRDSMRRDVMLIGHVDVHVDVDVQEEERKRREEAERAVREAQEKEAAEKQRQQQQHEQEKQAKAAAEAQEAQARATAAAAKAALAAVNSPPATASADDVIPPTPALTRLATDYVQPAAPQYDFTKPAYEHVTPSAAPAPVRGTIARGSLAARGTATPISSTTPTPLVVSDNDTSLMSATPGSRSTSVVSDGYDEVTSAQACRMRKQDAAHE